MSNLWPKPNCLLLPSSILCVLLTHIPPLSSLSWSQAKVDNEIIDYRDLAAIPRVKAIYDIEHPDMISYKSVNVNSSTLDNKGNRQDRQSTAEVTSSNAPSSYSAACLYVIVLVIFSWFDLWVSFWYLCWTRVKMDTRGFKCVLEQ